MKTQIQIQINQKTAQRLVLSLEAIAHMRVDKNTNHEQLSELCIAIARITLEGLVNERQTI